jgi:hypothetical protein
MFFIVARQLVFARSRFSCDCGRNDRQSYGPLSQFTGQGQRLPAIIYNGPYDTAPSHAVSLRGAGGVFFLATYILGNRETYGEDDD